MDTTASTIREFEDLLRRATPHTQSNALRFARNSVASSIAYMKYCEVGQRYRVSFLREGYNLGYWQSPNGWDAH